MASFYQSIDEKVDNTIIDIKDFGKYHKHVLSETDPMGVFKVKKLNNARYEDFFSQILKPRSKDGKILCSTASLLWIVFEDSREVLNTYKNIKHLRPMDKELVNFWIKEFEKPIEELYEYGINTISSAYGIVIDYYRDWAVKEKYDRIYSKGDKFDEWFKLAENNKSIIQGDDIPFDIKTISEKAKIMIQVRN